MATEGKTKVTYIAGSLDDGGAERLVVELIRHLDRRRFEPSLILMEDGHLERAKRWVAESFVVGIPMAGNSRWLGRSFSLLQAIRKITGQLAVWNCDIVHAFLPGPSILGGVAARLAGVPVMIGSRHSLVSLYRPRGRILALADRIAFRIADLTIGPSAVVTREMIGLGGCPPRKCRTVYNGVDISRFRPDLPPSWRASMGWSTQNIIIGMIANFRACKRHGDFARAAATIASRHPEARFVMVGADQGTRLETEKQVKELGLASKVSILDTDPSPEKIFAAIDIYVCTSTSEAFSLAVTEAMACGKPVIATSVGGMTEVMSHGETGFLVPPCSPDAVADAVEHLLQNRTVMRSMGDCGRRRVEKNFSLARMISAHEDLYHELLQQKRRLSRYVNAPPISTPIPGSAPSPEVLAYPDRSRDALR